MFVELERSVVQDLAAGRGDAGGELVLAVGGPTPLRADLQPILKSLGTIVYLQVDEAELLRRVMAGGVPAFLDGAADPEAAFLQLCHERQPVYESLADVTVNLNGLDPDQAVQRVEETLAAGTQ